MTTPQEEQPAARPAAAPTVSTAPPRSRWRFGTVPAHLGRARTSTVVLSVLFVLVAALWITVRPDPVTTGQTGSTTGVPVQQQPTAPARTTPPRTTTPPSSTTPRSTTPTRTTEGTTSGSSAQGTSTSAPGSASGSASGSGQPTRTSGEASPPVVPTTSAAPTS